MLSQDIAAAYVVIRDREWYVTGCPSDIERLHVAGFVERAWQIRLDNGHRPYAVLKQTIYFPITHVPTTTPKNAMTEEIALISGVHFAQNLHLVTDTMLLRKSPAFWSELEVAFVDERHVANDGYYAAYRGVVQPLIQNIKFSRIA